MWLHFSRRLARPNFLKGFPPTSALCGFWSAWTALLYLLAERTGFLLWRSEGSAPAGWMLQACWPLKDNDTSHRVISTTFYCHRTTQIPRAERLLLPWAGDKPEPHRRGGAHGSKKLWHPTVTFKHLFPFSIEILGVFHLWIVSLR